MRYAAFLTNESIVICYIHIVNFRLNVGSNRPVVFTRTVVRISRCGREDVRSAEVHAFDSRFEHCFLPCPTSLLSPTTCYVLLLLIRSLTTDQKRDQGTIFNFIITSMLLRSRLMKASQLLDNLQVLDDKVSVVALERLSAATTREATEVDVFGYC